MARIHDSAMPLVLRARKGSGYPEGTVTALCVELGLSVSLIAAQGWDFPKVVRQVDRDGTVTVLRDDTHSAVPPVR